jgi:hypothetical protein
MVWVRHQAVSESQQLKGLGLDDDKPQKYNYTGEETEIFKKFC